MLLTQCDTVSLHIRYKTSNNERYSYVITIFSLTIYRKRANIPDMKSFKYKKLAIVALAIAIVSVPTVYATTRPKHIQANQETPVIQQVKPQEEAKSNPEAQVNDIATAVKEVQATATNTKPAQINTVVQQTVTPTPVATPEPSPAPEPAPKPNPLTITQVLLDETYMSGDGTLERRRCQYLMAGGFTTPKINHPANLQCQKVGDIVPWSLSGCKSSFVGCI